MDKAERITFYIMALACLVSTVCNIWYMHVLSNGLHEALRLISEAQETIAKMAGLIESFSGIIG